MLFSFFFMKSFFPSSILLCNRFSLKITNESCNKGLKYCKSLEKEIKRNTFQKRIILKGNIATNYIEYKHKILELVESPFGNPHYSVLINSQNVTLKSWMKSVFQVSFFWLSTEQSFYQLHFKRESFNTRQTRRNRHDNNKVHSI